MSTRFAGALWRPRPERRNESATTNRVKLVTITRSPGAIDSTVISAISWIMRPLTEPLPGGSTWSRLKLWAVAAVATRSSGLAR